MLQHHSLTMFVIADTTPFNLAHRHTLQTMICRGSGESDLHGRKNATLTPMANRVVNHFVSGHFSSASTLSSRCKVSRNKVVDNPICPACEGRLFASVHACFFILQGTYRWDGCCYHSKSMQPQTEHQSLEEGQAVGNPAWHTDLTYLTVHKWCSCLVIYRRLRPTAMWAVCRMPCTSVANWGVAASSVASEHGYSEGAVAATITQRPAEITQSPAAITQSPAASILCLL